MKPARRWLVYPAILSAVLFWGLSFVWVKIVYRCYGPITTVFLRLVISSIALFALRALPSRALWRQGRKGRQGVKRWALQTRADRRAGPTRSELPSLMFLSLFVPFLYFLGEGFGLRLVSSTVASMVIATIPVVAPLFALAFVGERLQAWTAAGILLSFGGVSLVAVGKNLRFVASPQGLLLLMAAVLAASAYSILTRRLTTRLDVVTVVSYQNLFGALYFLPLFLVTEGRRFLAVVPSATVVVHLLLLGLFASSLAFIFNTYAIRELGVGKTTIFLNAVPVVTALFASLLLGEQMSAAKVGGIALVVAGVGAAQVRPAQVRPAATRRERRRGR